MQELEYENMKLSELIAKDERAFCGRVIAITDEHYDKYAAYRAKCSRNERYWRNKHWDESPKRDENEPQPNVPVIHSTTENCIADTMDNYPDQVLRGVNWDDDVISTIVTEALRVAFERANYRNTVLRAVRSAHIKGTGVLQAFFDVELDKGVGDVNYRYINIRDCVWDSDVKDINDGQFFAYFDWVTDDAIKQLFPDVNLDEIKAEQAENERDVNDYMREDVRDDKKRGNKIINFYWKEKTAREVGGEKIKSHKTKLYSAKILGTKILEKAEPYNYDSFMVHFLPFLELEEEPVGLSIIDIFQDDVKIINKIEQEYVKNLQASSVLRFMINNTANVNEQELMDFNKRAIHADVIHENAVREFKVQPFSSQALNYKEAKMGSIKEFSGQLDVNIGQSSAGVTAASAIMALQEYGAKRSRLFINRLYDEHKLIVKDTIFLMKEHYKTERILRVGREAKKIIDEQLLKAAQQVDGVREADNKLYIDFSQIDLANIEQDYDIQIVPQKKTAATSNLINSIVQQGIQAGAIPPDIMFELLEVPNIDKVNRKLKERMNVQQQMEQMEQQMEQMAQQLQAVGKTAEKMQKENEKLERELWNEKFNVLRTAVLNMYGGGGNEEGKETDEEGLQKAQAKIEQLFAQMGMGGQ